MALESNIIRHLQARFVRCCLRLKPSSWTHRRFVTHHGGWGTGASKGENSLCHDIRCCLEVSGCVRN